MTTINCIMKTGWARPITMAALLLAAKNPQVISEIAKTEITTAQIMEVYELFKAAETIELKEKEE